MESEEKEMMNAEQLISITDSMIRSLILQVIDHLCKKEILDRETVKKFIESWADSMLDQFYLAKNPTEDQDNHFREVIELVANQFLSGTIYQSIEGFQEVPNKEGFVN